jgi:hypothetical protein
LFPCCIVRCISVRVSSTEIFVCCLGIEEVNTFRKAWKLKLQGLGTFPRIVGHVLVRTDFDHCALSDLMSFGLLCASTFELGLLQSLVFDLVRQLHQFIEDSFARVVSGAPSLGPAPGSGACPRTLPAFLMSASKFKKHTRKCVMFFADRWSAVPVSLG